MLTIAAYTHRGLWRHANEDCIGIGSRIFASDMIEPTILETPLKPTALLVADGLGGHGNGAIASRTSVAFLQSRASLLTDAQGIQSALNELHKDVLTLAGKSEFNTPMGTTIVGALIQQHSMMTFNIGDSRAYLHSYGQLIQISRDDSVASVGVKAQGAKHLVTQSIGGSWFCEEIDPHCANHPPLRPGERLLLCSDGLTRMIGDAEIESIFNNGRDIKEIIGNLVSATLKAGARDNVSIVVAEVASTHSATQKPAP